jgi:alpha-tubulin suppressor-like RCC1 family protein
VVIAAGGHAHSIALLDDGSLQSWGAGWEGQLGQDGTVQQKRPHPVGGGVQGMGV